ncbi:hypothetical protein MWLf4_1149 [Limosilactobacillus fermentum]|nr:hypothetical protein MWLf4_1149 [Limosilactobacillus fermentum]
MVVNNQNFKAGGAFFCALKTKKSCQRITTMVIHQQDLV